MRKSVLKQFLNKIKNSKLAMNYIWVLLGQNIGTVFSMLSLIVTLRVITTLEYGSLVVIQTYALLISNLFGFRTFNGLIKYVTDAENENDYQRAKKYINTAFCMDCLAGAVAFVLGIVLLEPIVKIMGWDSSTMEMVLYYFPLVLFLPILNGAPVGVLRKINCFKQVNMVHATVFGIQLVALVALWIFGSHSLLLVLLVYELTEILECLVLVYLAYKKLNGLEQYQGFAKAGIIRDMGFIKYNFMFGLTTAVDQILGNVSTLLIDKYVGTLATAYLKVITRICGVISKLTSPIGQIFYPELCEWIAQKNYKKAYRIAMKFFLIICGVGSVAVFLLFITYDWWIILFDAAMENAKWQSLLYLLYTEMSTSMICNTVNICDEIGQ